MLFIVGSGSETWVDVICTKPRNSSNFLISIEECNILQDNRDCVTMLRKEGHIQDVCSAVQNVYTCRVSQEYAPRTCCLSYTPGSHEPTYNSCSIGKCTWSLCCVTALKYLCGFCACAAVSTVATGSTTTTPQGGTSTTAPQGTPQGTTTQEGTITSKFVWWVLYCTALYVCII